MGINYANVGLKCGLEIHQQLDVGKLFCNCNGILRSEEPDFFVERKLHAVAGEGGKVDAAALHEAEKDKNFVYEGYDSVCLVELDEEPPHKINPWALEMVLQISVLLNAKIFPLTQIMRKTVIDGSNTSGFQRTTLIARDGYVETSFGRVGIESICLEEDSARKISEDDLKKVFRLDRLGIPLVEIATSPDIHTPEQAKEVALYLGDLLRSFKVKRGLGTIRQDVNVSVSKGARVEIKGFQNPAMMSETIDKEIERQLKIVDSGQEVQSEVRNALPSGETKFLRPMPGSARMYPETDLPLLKISRDMINQAKKGIPQLRKDVKKDLEKIGLNQEMIKLLFKQNKLEEFREFLKILDKPNLIAKSILVYPKELSKKNDLTLEEVEEIFEEKLPDILNKVKAGKIPESNLKHVLEMAVKGEEHEEFSSEGLKNIEEKILKIINGKPGLSEKAYMGLVMKEFKGKISGKEAMDIIGKILGK